VSLQAVSRCRVLFFWVVGHSDSFFSNGAATGKNEGPAGKATQSMQGLFFEKSQNML
jgi:hypothetical protein